MLSLFAEEDTRRLFIIHYYFFTYMAHWQIFLPYRLTFENRGAMQDIFAEQYQNDFVFEKSREYLIPYPASANGKRYVYGKIEESYTLQARIVEREFGNFYRLFTHEFRKLYGGENRNFQSNIFQTEELLPFVLQLDRLYLRNFQDKSLQEITRLKENKFLKLETLSATKTLEGYPLPTHYSSQMQVISLLQSHQPMNTNRYETIAFHNFVEHIQDLCQHKYSLAKHLFVASC
ncbi:MAG: hypothetical protein ACKVTZ_05360 [Bacteroidia bacterium]